MKKILALLLTALGLSSTFGRLYPEGLKNTACSQNFESIDVQQFSELIADSNVVILDVRKASEYAEGHIKGAVLIDQFKSDFMEQAKARLPKDRTILAKASVSFVAERPYIAAAVVAPQAHVADWLMKATNLST